MDGGSGISGVYFELEQRNGESSHYGRCGSAMGKEDDRSVLEEVMTAAEAAENGDLMLEPFSSLARGIKEHRPDSTKRRHEKPDVSGW